jgi:tetratricopeptide (TPR) repeat protein
MTAREAKKKAFDSLNEGTLAYEQGDYRRAVDLLREAAAISLNSFQAHYELGLALRDSRLYSDALEPLGIALELNPKHLQAHVAKGDCYLKLGDAAEAEAEYQRALDLQPDYVQAHLALGDAYLKQGDTSEARAEYLRALELQPNYAAAHTGLGAMFESLGEDDHAEEQYRLALEINVTHADAYVRLGDLFLRRDRADDAIDLFLKAIRIKPDFSRGFTQLGAAYARQQLYDEAIAAGQKKPRPLARINPTSPTTRRSEITSAPPVSQMNGSPLRQSCVALPLTGSGTSS